MADALNRLSEEAIAALDAGDPQKLIDFHRTLFGGIVMEHTDDPDDPDEGDDEDAEDDEDDSTDDDGDEDDADDDSDEDDSLGDKGRKALDRMKAERRTLKQTIRELKAQIAELRNADGEEDELETSKRETKTERDKRVAAEKRLAAKEAGLPASWAKRLEGDDYDDFLEDAEALAADLPTPNDRKGGGGAKDGHRKRRKPSLDDQIAEAEKNGDARTARRLKAQKIHMLHQQQ